MISLVAAAALFALALLNAIIVSGWRDALRRMKAGGEVDGGSPDVQVTVVIPARNAADTLIPLLQDLHAQDMPLGRMDVLVVDDDSVDDTAGIVQSMMRTWPRLRYAKNEGQGKKAAISTGVALVGEGIILLTDADVHCGKQRVSSIADRMRRSALDMLLAPVSTVGGRGLLGRLQEEEQSGLIGVAAGEALLGRPLLANGANMAFTRSAFFDVQGYVGDRFASGDDVFLVQRMKTKGKRIGYIWDECAIVTVDAEPTWSGAIQQRLRWAGKMRGVKGGLSWAGLVGLFLPWMLLLATCTCLSNMLIREHGVETMLLIAVAWLLWLVPAVRLVARVKRFFGQRYSPATTLVCYIAFTLYAPMLALTALFIRPTWKGRRI